MPTLITLKLYTTSNCHLCDQAVELVKQSYYIEELELIEIIDDASLLSCYGTRIPVLQRTDNLMELDWPFSLNDINNFMNTMN